MKSSCADTREFFLFQSFPIIFLKKPVGSQSFRKSVFSYSGHFPGNCAYHTKLFPVIRLSCFAIKISQNVMI